METIFTTYVIAAKDGDTWTFLHEAGDPPTTDHELALKFSSRKAAVHERVNYCQDFGPEWKVYELRLDIDSES